MHPDPDACHDASKARDSRGPRDRREDVEGVTLRLDYRPPLHWTGLAGFLASRGAGRCEQFDGRQFRRSLQIGRCRGWICVQPSSGRAELEALAAPTLLPVRAELRGRLRRLFDLDAQPQLIDANLSRDPRLAAAVRRTPGLRIPGCVDGFEVALRAVLGQQISVKAASTLYARCVERFGEPISSPFDGLDRLPPTAERLAGTPLEALRALGLPQRRAQTVQALARCVADGEVVLDGSQPTAEVLTALQALPGIGPWTAQYVAMRALADPDVFPHADLGLLKALGVASAAAMQRRADAWRPWRAYAAMHLWNELGAGG